MLLLNPTFPLPSSKTSLSTTTVFPPPPPPPPPPPSAVSMDSSDFPVARSPRKELQGPRPPALKVRKDSHKIKKPPVAPNPNPNPNPNPHNHHQPPPPRAPVIIYTVSPKVIHTNPDDFMTLVQRLTGSSTSAAAENSSNVVNNPFGNDPGAMSPAARYASIEKTRSPKEKASSNYQNQNQIGNEDLGDFFMEGVEMGERLPPGILSPGPGSLPPISPSFFCPPASNPNPDPSAGFFHDLSPAGLHSSRGFLEGGLLPSPNNFIAGFSPHANSPFPSIDLFNNFTSGNFDF
ncbi:Nuclear speckle RNA-binding protein B [Linum grandiflorum]